MGRDTIEKEANEVGGEYNGTRRRKRVYLKAGKACFKCSTVGYFSRLDLKQRRTKGASPGANTSYNDTLKSANVSRSNRVPPCVVFLPQSLSTREFLKGLSPGLLMMIPSHPLLPSTVQQRRVHIRSKLSTGSSAPGPGLHAPLMSHDEVIPSKNMHQMTESHSTDQCLAGSSERGRSVYSSHKCTGSYQVFLMVNPFSYELTPQSLRESIYIQEEHATTPPILKPFLN